MKEIVTVFFGLLFLTAVVSLGLFYWQFQSWPPKLWQVRLVDRVAALLARRRELTADDDNPTGRRVRQLSEEMFRRQLRTVPVDRLVGFPGIGPGTVERVRGGGCGTLADLIGYPFETLPGIGPVKARELRLAVRRLAHEARAKFDAGASPEAQEYLRQLAEFKTEQRNSAVARDRELAAVEEALDECDELLVLARDVSFWNYLFHRDIPGITDELLARPLPVAKPVPVVVPVAPPVPMPAVAAVARPVGAPDLFAPTVPPPLASDGPHPWLPKLRAFARFGLAVARADGRVAQAEKKVIRAFLAEKFGHDGVLTRHIDPLMERAEAEAPSDREALAEVLPVTTPGERQELYVLAGRIVDASGEQNQRERDALARVADGFQLKASGERPGLSRPEPQPPPPSDGRDKPGRSPDAHAVLDIDAATELSPELIRRRYTLLTEKLDPAKAAAMGPEFVRMAEEKRAAVRAAAEQLLAPFGVPLDPPAAAPAPADLRHNPDLDDVFGG